MDMTVKHILEFSPEAQDFLKGLVSVVAGKVEAQSREDKTCACSQKDEKPDTTDTVPVKKTRKPRAKKESSDPVQETPAEEKTPEPIEVSTEQVSQIAYKAFEKLSKDPEAPIGPDALTKKMRTLVLGEEKANDPECHENAAISSLTDAQRVTFVEWCASPEVGCADIVAEELGREV